MTPSRPACLRQDARLARRRRRLAESTRRLRRLRRHRLCRTRRMLRSRRRAERWRRRALGALARRRGSSRLQCCLTWEQKSNNVNVERRSRRESQTQWNVRAEALSQPC
eukprot:2015807-Pleurochrysis_carterae.AAC.1